MSEQTKQFYAFGPYRLDSQKRVLVRDGVPVPLAPKAAETLLLLVKNAGHLVEKDELMARVWPDAIVEDGNLNRNVFVLRQLLGEWDGGRAYIETVPKRGYRFVAPVEEVTHAEVGAQPTRSTDGNLIGKRVSHYRLLEIVGGGGMGLVYKAEDLKLGRRVALKFLPEELASDPVALRRFEREARTASSLNHPNICSIHEFGEHEGQPFLVMELLEGETLRDRLIAATTEDKGIPLDDLLRITVQVADGLEAAHEKGIIHRDIKPANIFLTAKGTVKILDFGLAKLATSTPEIPEEGEIEERTFQPSASSTQSVFPKNARKDGMPTLEHTLTQTGTAMGTAGYMSPEQVRGEVLDSRTDLFSFGLVLYEMATGRKAFAGDTAAVVHEAILYQPPQPARQLNSKLPPKLVAIIDHCLQKDRDLRYQRARDISADLRRTKHARQSARRHWLFTIAAVFAIVSALLIWIQTRQQPAQTDLKLRQLTFNSPENSVRAGSAMSPDGKYLAYSDYRGTHIKQIDIGKVRDVALPEELKNNPDWQVIQWFPDGTRILADVTSGKHPSVWTISASGEEVRKLRDDALAWSISPNSSQIAFAAEDDLWLMNAYGENASRLYKADNGSRLVDVRWSPHGQRLLYTRLEKSDASLESRDLGGGPITKILSFTDNSLLGDIWLPDGHILYLVMDRSANEYTCNYWELLIDEQTGLAAGKPRRVTNWTGSCTGDESVTADGKRIAFRQWAAQHSVYIANLEANGTRISTPRQFTPNKSKHYPSSWTADSSAVVFSSRGLGQWGIYKQSLESETAEPVVSLPGYGVYEDLENIALPKASPDGKWILYTLRDESDSALLMPSSRLIKVAVSGGRPELVMTGIFYGPPSCANPPASLCAIAEQSSDLKQLMFTTVDPRSGRGPELARIDVETDGSYVWALSPDGSKVALLNTVRGPVRILSFRNKSTREVRVKSWDRLDSVAFASDGKSLFASSRTQRGSVLLHVDLQGNSHVLWTQEGGAGTYAIPSPDGRHLAIKSWTLDSNIWMMENY